MDPFADLGNLQTQQWQQLEDLAGGWPGLRNLGDHFLIVMRKA